MPSQIDSPIVKRCSKPNRKVMTLKSQLQIYLEMRNLSAAELSRKSGVSKQVISQWLGGAEPRKLSQVKKVAQVLETSVDHLCFGDGRDEESQRITELDALMGEGWLGGLFEIKFRRVKRGGK